MYSKYDKPDELFAIDKNMQAMTVQMGECPEHMM